MLEFRESSVCGVNVDFFKNWSERMAWCVGLIYTDGNVGIARHHNTKYVEMDNTDFEILDKFTSFSCCTYKLVRKDTKKYNRGNKYSYRVCITNSRLYDVITSLGVMPAKSKIVKFPCMFPINYMPDFVRGCWDGDGSVRFNGNGYFICSIKMGSKDFIYGLDDYITRVTNLRAHKVVVDECGDSVSYAIYLYGENARKLCRWMYHDNMQDAYLTRKYDNWRRVIE